MQTVLVDLQKNRSLMQNFIALQEWWAQTNSWQQKWQGSSALLLHRAWKHQTTLLLIKLLGSVRYPSTWTWDH